MKIHLLFIALSFYAWNAAAQNTEFNTSAGALIYSENTIQHLKFIVDSLNLKYKTCDLTTIYKAIPQAKGNFFFIEGDNADAAKKDLDNGANYEQIIQKYHPEKTDTGVLILKFYDNSEIEGESIEFNSLSLNERNDYTMRFKINLDRYSGNLQNKTVYEHYPKGSYNKSQLTGFYFTEELTQPPLPEKYARLIQYSDCLIDTTASIYLKNTSQYSRDKEATFPKMQAFNDYVNKATRSPTYNGRNFEKYLKQKNVWDSLKFSRIDNLRKKDGKFDDLLKAALDEATVFGSSDNSFEEFIGQYYSKEKALELKRGRRVMGMCSMDGAPREHAFQIAKLSAETVNWEIFLRAHLDIMNDRFDRASDGSYAQGPRQTYIKELEVLDINVQDLLLGISLRLQNASQNHYFGSINRIGRALSETAHAHEIETAMLTMISDPALDRYNRILMYYLFLNYNYNLSDESRKVVNKTRLNEAVKSMPAYLAEKMMVVKN